MLISRHRAQGFTLIEVLVTLLIVAIGLLAAAGLQILSKKAAFDAQQRTTATLLAQDIIERMRANTGQLARYHNTEVKAEPTNQNCNSTSKCTALQLVTFDISRWWQALIGANESGNAGGLSNPTGCISVVGGCRVRVAIAWRGVTPISQTADSGNSNDPIANTCGVTNTNYDETAAGDHRYRRIVVVNANLSNGTLNADGSCP